MRSHTHTSCSTHTHKHKTHPTQTVRRLDKKILTECWPPYTLYITLINPLPQSYIYKKKTLSRNNNSNNNNKLKEEIGPFPAAWLIPTGDNSAAMGHNLTYLQCLLVSSYVRNNVPLSMTFFKMLGVFNFSILPIKCFTHKVYVTPAFCLFSKH